MGNQQDVPMWVRVDLSPRGKTELKPAEDLGEVISDGRIAKTKAFCAQEPRLSVSGKEGFYMGTLRIQNQEAVESHFVECFKKLERRQDLPLKSHPAFLSGCVHMCEHPSPAK